MTTLSIDERQELLKAALDARSLSYSPYSKFRVGAALLLKNGEIVLGANVENASYGAGICAERTALVKAATSHAASAAAPPGSSNKSPLTGQIKAIAVSSDLPTDPCSPCGICRQFMREFCELDMPIFMVWGEWNPDQEQQQQQQQQECESPKGYIKRTLEQLLPLSFGPEELDKPRSS